MINISREVLKNITDRISSEQGIDERVEISDAMLNSMRIAIEQSLERRWHHLPPEIGGGGRPDQSSWIVVRKRRQLAYTFKLSNFSRDPIGSGQAAALAMAATHALPTVLALPTLPPTFPGFLIGLCVGVMRAFTHNVGYGEAALLHRMNELAGEGRFVTNEEIKDVGSVLVERYNYKKGSNTNEVSSLLQSLVSWGAIREVEGGYRVIETVPFGLGPTQYVS